MKWRKIVVADDGKIDRIWLAFGGVAIIVVLAAFACE